MHTVPFKVINFFMLLKMRSYLADIAKIVLQIECLTAANLPSPPEGKLAKEVALCDSGRRICSNFLWGELASMYFHGSWHCPRQLPHLPSPVATLSGITSGGPSAKTREPREPNSSAGSEGSSHGREF
jgi:hypothetical protein